MKVTIDGQEIEVEAGTTILQAHLDRKEATTA